MFSPIFRIRIYEFFRQNFSLEKENKFPIGQKGIFFLSCEHLRKSKQIICSWHQKTKPQIHQFTNLKCCIKAKEPFKTPFIVVSFLIYYFKNYFKPCVFILKTLKDILQHFELVNSGFSFFDVTNRLQVLVSCNCFPTTIWIFMQFCCKFFFVKMRKRGVRQHFNVTWLHSYVYKLRYLVKVSQR